MNKNNKPIISVIVPNRNFAVWLPAALESVRAQTFTNLECIVVDDASDDNSVHVIKEFIKNDPRFHLIELKKHSGIAAARNRGLDIARGQYIAFLDSDDCYTQNALEILLQLIKTTNADLAGGRAKIVGPEFKFVPTKHTNFTLEHFSTTPNPIDFMLANTSHKWVWVWRRIYKREFIGKTRFNEAFKTMGDDLCFMLDLYTKDCLIAECANTVVYHRAHYFSITASQTTTNSFDWFPTYFTHIRDNLLDKYDDKFWRFFYNQTFLYLLRETVIKPKEWRKFQTEGKKVLLECSRLIPRHYLKSKFRILCWFLSCMK